MLWIFYTALLGLLQANPSTADCIKQANKDILADNLKQISGQPESNCCSVCALTPGCKGYAWNDYSGGTCWLKGASGPLGDKSGVSVGILNSGGQECQKHSNKDIGAPNLKQVSGKPEGECCSVCASTPECLGYAWNDYSGGTCWLKSSTGPLIDKAGVSAGVLSNKASAIEQLKEDVKNGRTPIHGVNLGGWLVAEKWMTSGSPIWADVPDPTANQGEYKTMEYLGHATGDARFKQHRDTFITEQDFADIKRANLNTVRIPVGYWITEQDTSGGGDPNAWRMFAPGAIHYLDQAIREWAPRHNLLVLISMHAAKGSQNGNDHSSPSTPGVTNWSNYPENVQNTLDVVEFLARRYNNDVSFLGIGLLNEPSGNTNEAVLKQYYYDAYGRIRQFSNCLLTVAPLLSQQSASASDWSHFMPPPQFHGVLHEWHRYQIWGYEGWNKDRLIDYAQNGLRNDIAAWNGNWLFIGEWSIAWPGSANFDNDDDLRRYATAQLQAFKGAHAGWTYWTWKFYGDSGKDRNAWSMKAMLNKGLIQL